MIPEPLGVAGEADLQRDVGGAGQQKRSVYASGMTRREKGRRDAENKRLTALRGILSANVLTEVVKHGLDRPPGREDTCAGRRAALPLAAISVPPLA